MTHRSGPRRAQCLIVAAVAVLAVLAGGPAGATGHRYTGASLHVVGGRGHAVEACLHYANYTARQHRRPQADYCANVLAVAGDALVLRRASIVVLSARTMPPGTSLPRRYDTATVWLTGVELTWMVACAHYLDGTATPAQEQRCGSGVVVVENPFSSMHLDLVILTG